MPVIVPDSISWTTHQLHFCFVPTDLVISSGTGFVYERAGKSYLITNWHNVTGRNTETGKCLSETRAIPDIISTMFRDKSVPAQCTRENLALYKDDAMHEPAWYEHPKHGHAVDVVALPIAEHISSRYRLLPINGIPFDKQYKEEVADTAFIVGYPFPDATAFQLPIWKRASIASEPDVDVDQLPKILVDTATRPGLSGSPVVMQRVGLHGLVDGAMVATSLIGTIRNFIGVYSGRIGTDELKAQLGIVWKSRVIDEIVDAAVLGRPPHEA